MTVAEYIEELKELDQDKDIEVHAYTYDGFMYEFVPIKLS